MAAPVPVQRTLSDGVKRTLRHITIPEGGDADVAATIVVDTSALTGGGVTATTHKIIKIQYALHGFAVNLHFDATTDVHAVSLTGSGTLDFNFFGGLTNNAGAGITGDIVMTTNGIAALDDENDDNTGFFIIETEKVV